LQNYKKSVKIINNIEKTLTRTTQIKKDLRELEVGEILVETILFVITYVVSKLKLIVSLDVNLCVKDILSGKLKNNFQFRWYHGKFYSISSYVRMK